MRDRDDIKATNVYIKKSLHKEAQIKMIEDHGRVNMTALFRAVLKLWLKGDLDISQETIQKEMDRD